MKYPPVSKKVKEGNAPMTKKPRMKTTVKTVKTPKGEPKYPRKGGQK